jgi:acetyltransferase-like isoleucine patch superfamily enzyme
VIRSIFFKVRNFYHTYIISTFVRWYLQLIGIKVGKNFFSRSFPQVVIDQSSSISLGKSINFKGKVEIRAVNGANIYFEDCVRLDKDVRIVATNHALVTFSQGADIGCYSIFNRGTNFFVGQNTLVAGFCYFQTSNHKIEPGRIIKDQGYTHHEITIGAGCWIGGGCLVLAGAKIDDGCVIGANSLVNSHLKTNSIAFGSPARVKRKR